jgi:MFS family permease
MTRGQTRELMSDRPFRLWFIAQMISYTGTAASAVALPLLVYQSSGSAALTAAVVGLEALPYLLFGALAGALADRTSRTTTMVTANLWCAFVLATPVVLRAFDALPTWYVLVVAFAVGTGFCWFNSAAWGAQTTLVGRERLAEANRLVWTVEIVLDIGAPAVAGVLATLADPTLVIAFDAATYLVAALLIVRLRGRLDAPAQARVPGRRLRTEIMEGFRYLWRQPVIRALTIGGFWLSVSFGGATGLVIVHADRLLDVGATDSRIGLLFAARAIGSVVAALALPRLGRRLGQGPASIYAYVVYGVAITALAFAHDFALALMLWALFELARLTATMNGITIRQQLTPDELQGRVNTTGRMIAWGGAPFGALVGGVLAQTVNVTVAFVVLAVAGVLGLALLLASPVRALRTAVPA